MARKQLEGTLAEIVEAIALEDAERGHPSRGQHVGRGPHADMPADWDGVGETPPGWTATYAVPEAHPITPGLYAMPVRDAAHETRLIGVRLAGRPPITPADFRSRAPDWTPTGEG